MIIRSGLIRNRDGVDFDAFTQHWKDVHAPLVVEIDGLRAYSQNHVRERLTASGNAALHRVDGISQLYFDDVDSMKVAMSSPEQEACIVDLRGFLSDVTLLIQQAGELNTIGDQKNLSRKNLYLLQGKEDVLNAALSQIKATLGEGQGWKYRVNPIVTRDVVVDHSITAGGQVVDMVLEIWTGSEAANDASDSIISTVEGIEVVGGFAVDEFVVIPQK